MVRYTREATRRVKEAMMGTCPPRPGRGAGYCGGDRRWQPSQVQVGDGIPPPSLHLPSCPCGPLSASSTIHTTPYSARCSIRSHKKANIELAKIQLCLPSRGGEICMGPRPCSRPVLPVRLRPERPSPAVHPVDTTQMCTLAARRWVPLPSSAPADPKHRIRLLRPALSPRRARRTSRSKRQRGPYR